MARELRSVFVTHHALSRWQERVCKTDAADAVEAALRSAVPIEKGEPLPFARQDGNRYYRHAERETVYLVTDPRSIDTEAVVTVLDTQQFANEGRSRLADDAPPPWAEPEHESPQAKCDWFQAQVAEHRHRMARINEEYSRKSKVRLAWVERFGMVLGLYAAAKTELKRHNRKMRPKVNRAELERQRQERLRRQFVDRINKINAGKLVSKEALPHAD